MTLTVHGMMYCLGSVHRVYGLRQGPNFGVQSAGGKNVYLQLTVEKMPAFAVFTEKY